MGGCCYPYTWYNKCRRPLLPSNRLPQSPLTSILCSRLLVPSRILMVIEAPWRRPGENWPLKMRSRICEFRSIGRGYSILSKHPEVPIGTIWDTIKMESWQQDNKSLTTLRPATSAHWGPMRSFIWPFFAKSPHKVRWPGLKEVDNAVQKCSFQYLLWETPQNGSKWTDLN